MQKEDLIYLANNISTLCQIPVRIYRNKKLFHFYYSVDLIKDPFYLHEFELSTFEKEISYITTADFFYYAYVKYQTYTFVFGPFRLIQPEDSIITKMALDLNISKDDIYEFKSAIKSIKCASLDNVIHVLCMLYFALNKKKITLSDILIDEDKSKTINDDINHEIKNNEINQIESYSNNSFFIEQELYRIVEHGEIDELRSWLKNAPAIHPGILSNDTLRHTKNTFIAAATLISRSAIKGNMDPIQALALSDLYIQKMELLQTNTDIYTLQINMVLDYTQQVAKIHGKKDASSLLVNFNKYVLSHLSNAIKIDDICKELYVSKSVLFDKIKKETNMTVSNYILNIKINESKSLLKYTDKPISAISLYLGFSSQSHFNHVFKKITNKTPIEYRNSHK